MAYKIYRFGTAQMVPNVNTAQDIGAGAARIEAVDFPHGGAYDQLGNDQSFRGGYRIKTAGTIVGTGAADLVTKYNALRAYLGKKDRLWRRNDTGDLYWVWARLESIEVEREEKHRFYLEIELTFYVYSPLWNGNLIGSWRFDSGETFDSSLLFDTGLSYPLTNLSNTIIVANGGNAVLRSFEMAITASGTPITSLRLLKAGQTDITWSGMLEVGSQLVFDFGGLSVRNSGVDAYNGLVISSANHKIDDWMMLDPGNNEITIARTGGNGSSVASFSYYDGWI